MASGISGGNANQERKATKKPTFVINGKSYNKNKKRPLKNVRQLRWKALE